MRSKDLTVGLRVAVAWTGGRAVLGDQRLEAADVVREPQGGRVYVRWVDDDKRRVRGGSGVSEVPTRDVVGTWDDHLARCASEATARAARRERQTEALRERQAAQETLRRLLPPDAATALPPGLLTSVNGATNRTTTATEWAAAVHAAHYAGYAAAHEQWQDAARGAFGLSDAADHRKAQQ